MNLPFYASKRKREHQVDETPGDNREAMLQAVLVALLACLVWGGPFSNRPAKRDGGADGGSTVLSDREDVSRHLEGTMNAETVTNITEDELRYHYFQSHDFDDNKVLDGMEMLKAVLHSAPGKQTSSLDLAENGSQNSSSTQQSSISATTEFYVGVIDRVLSEGDLDKDGFLSYPEYVLANERAIKRQKEHNIQQDPL